MAEIEIYDAFEDCLNRVYAGESIEDCLQDYPQYAEKLRGLLETGELVYHAQIPKPEVVAEQAQMRTQVEQNLRQQQARKPKPASRRSTRWIAVVAAAAAIIALASVVFLSLLGPAVGNIYSGIPMSLGSSAFEITATAIVQVNETVFVEALTPATSSTDGLGESPTASSTATPTVTTTATPTAMMTATALGTLEPGLVATSVALMSPMPPMTATAEQGLQEMATLPPLATASMGIPQQFSPTPLPPVEVMPLNAGEIDDNAEWDTYLQYRANYLQQYSASVRDLNVTGRQIITVRDAQGLPVIGARVQVFAGGALVSETQTYATGKTLFFPHAHPALGGQQSYNVVVMKGNATAEFTLDPQRGFDWYVTLENLPQRQSGLQLDVLFLLDATGSMSDEIAQLQNNILGISSQIAALGGNVDTRYGLVAYRDRGDAYVTRIYDFVPNVNTFQVSLNSVSAEGGGDTPESLNEALHEAVQGVSWRGEDTVKLVFLVADAAPHLDYPNDYDYVVEIQQAAAHGIKIHPIASSGLTPDGEFIFRQIAQVTMGHFIFLTYEQGTGGAPGETRSDLSVGEPADPQQQRPGDYTVEQLADLVMRLIQEELAALSSPVETANGIEALTRPIATPTPTPAQTQTSQLVPLPTDLSWPLAAGLVALGVLFGYSLRQKPTAKRKRKRFEIVEEE